MAGISASQAAMASGRSGAAADLGPLPVHQVVPGPETVAGLASDPGQASHAAQKVEGVKVLPASTVP